MKIVMIKILTAFLLNCFMEFWVYIWVSSSNFILFQDILTSSKKVQLSTTNYQIHLAALNCLIHILIKKQKRHRKSHNWGIKISFKIKENTKICNMSLLPLCHVNMQYVNMSLYMSIQPSATSEAILLSGNIFFQIVDYGYCQSSCFIQKR